MKSIILVSLAASLSGAGAAIAQEPTSFGLLEGVAEHPEVAAMPREAHAPTGVHGDMAEPRAARGIPLSTIPLASLRATRERPVFSESRRPPVIASAEPVRLVEPPSEPEPAEPEAPDLTLVGTVVGLDASVAIFLKPSARDVVKLHIGEADSGWTVRNVEPKTTTLEKDSREVTLSLPEPDALAASNGDAPGGVNAFMSPPFGGVPGNNQVSRGKPPVPFPSALQGRRIPPRARPGHEF